MITFVPSWEDTANIRESTDDLINQMRSYLSVNQSYRICIWDYIPNLQHFLHRFDLLESSYISLFEKLQGFYEKEELQLTLNDLKFPEDVVFIYAESNISVLQNNEVVSRIMMGDEGYIAEIQYFVSSHLSKIDVYNDRGYLSSQKNYSKGILDHISYFDSEGKRIFVQKAGSGECTVDSENTHGLLLEYYDSILDIKFELLEKFMLREDNHQYLISVTTDNIKKVSQLGEKFPLVLSFSKSHYQYSPRHNQLLEKVATAVKGIIVDSLEIYELFINLGISGHKIYKVSPFDTRFDLSISQELKEEVIYLEAREIETVVFFNILSNLVSYFWQGITKEARTFKLVVRVTEDSYDYFLKQVENLLNQLFPKEMSFLNNQKDMLENKDLELIYPELEFEKVKLLQDNICIKILRTEEELFKILHETRLVIDLGREPDLFTQMAGISAGIPQINTTLTEYVINYQNGLIINNISELVFALSYYLESLRHWQEARVFAIHQMREYSGYKLYSKITKIFEVQING